ncbi:phosphatase PAP2 family protein [Porphyrobacter sp. LM 6]|uniref:phosphatase PAP2 family protein n=1 Tax=Porphyrobacter sp. LM 6 TaxID=1896196 RepID=UPI0008476F3A|nr:phosphatase PAP2 family protein [Porphyrobacter sp. LM 6]
MNTVTLFNVRPTFDWLFLALVAIVVAVCGAILSVYGVPFDGPASYVVNAVLYLISWFLLELPSYGMALRTSRPESPLAFTGTYLKQRWPIYRDALPLVISLIVFMPMFSKMKAGVSLFTQYTWDATLIAWDRAIFGTDAWLVLQPIFGIPIVTSALSVAYHTWVLLIYAGSIFFAAYWRSLRQRFFLSFLAIWTIGGIAMAVGFASVGPAFAEPLLGNPTFAPQMAYLREANEHWPVMVLDVQETLLAWHRSEQFGLGRGITAMPSMHVALSMLFWLAMRHVSKAAGWFFGIFNAVIFVGSIHLAYHYAVDGIVSAILAVVFWFLSGLITDGRSGRREPAGKFQSVQA